MHPESRYYDQIVRQRLILASDGKLRRFCRCLPLDCAHAVSYTNIFLCYSSEPEGRCCNNIYPQFGGHAKPGALKQKLVVT